MKPRSNSQRLAVSIKKINIRQQSGISLIEVLVALLLVSIAGFSVLTMSSFSMKETNSIRYEVSADYLGQALLARIKTNATLSNQALYQFNSDTAITNTADCDLGCNPLEIARLDSTEWSQEAKDLLPEAQYKTWWVDNQIMLAISWEGPVQEKSSSACPLTDDDAKTCRVYVASVSL